MQVTEFMEVWQQALGRFSAACIVATLSLLKGYVLVDSPEGGIATIILFPASELSHMPRRRFDQLFAMRKRWQLEDLQPFVECVLACLLCRLRLSYNVRPLSLHCVRSCDQTVGWRIYQAC